MLEKQFRLLYQIKNLKNNMDELTMSRNLGVNSYVIKKISSYINNFTNDEIINILYELSNVDYDLKVNNYDKNSVIESFLLKI